MYEWQTNLTTCLLQVRVAVLLERELVELESWPLYSEDWVGCSPKALIIPLTTLATVEVPKQTFGSVIFLTTVMTCVHT